jgi:hypothetical protein
MLSSRLIRLSEWPPWWALPSQAPLMPSIRLSFQKVRR